MTESGAGTAWYAYAVVGPVTPELRAGLGRGLDLIGTEEAAVVGTDVPLADFGEEVLPDRLNDRRWLEHAATRHAAVVQELLPLTTVVPLRFGSVHHGQAAVARFLEAHRDEFRATLDRLRGRVEYGVKVWLDTKTAAPTASAPPPATGREYLERRRRAADHAAAAGAELDDRLREIHARLLAAADEGALNRPQPRELTGSTREMVLNAAYLVPAGSRALLDELDRLRAEHADLELEATGPWAPYNFVEEEAG
jgi:hypothetical protein